jgi:UDP-glucose 4-epimerase
LIDAGYKVVIVDSLYNSSDEVINRIELLTGVRPKLYNADITNEAALENIFSENPDIDNVIHFAALKVILLNIMHLYTYPLQAVGESGEIPLDYWRVNVYGSLCLLKAMDKHGVTNIVISSSATVYGDATRFPNMIPIPENCPIGATNVYGHTKVAVEDMITAQIKTQRNRAKKAGKSGNMYNAALLRYFNPAGAHPSGIMGEDPQGVPYNLLPLLAQVAVGKREKLLVFGDGKKIYK